MRAHELHSFMRKASKSMAEDYERISTRSPEDAGTACDQGEANWEHLFSEWLPAGYHVRTKGRILSATGVASTQVDIVILKKSYPLGLLRDKLYLADGVLAAFECKLTLRPEHIKEAFQNCRFIKKLVNGGGESTTPYRELHAPIIYGLVAHSHSRKHRKVGAIKTIESNIIQADRTYCEHPKFMLDCVCVADSGFWQAVKYARYPGPIRNGSFVPMSVYRRRASAAPYLETGAKEDDPVCTPIGGLISDLLVRLAWEDPALRPIATYFMRVSVGRPVGRGTVREWPFSIFSNGVQQRLASTKLLEGWPASDWNEWSWEYS
jgi:hypothetical protein